jgi:hypothetical protein
MLIGTHVGKASFQNNEYFLRVRSPRVTLFLLNHLDFGSSFVNSITFLDNDYCSINHFLINKHISSNHHVVYLFK